MMFQEQMPDHDSTSRRRSGSSECSLSDENVSEVRAAPAECSEFAEEQQDAHDGPSALARASIC